ncbi:MAG: hypothetical protein ACO2PO_07195 [Candidatus Calescibacterium sp.]
MKVEIQKYSNHKKIKRKSFYFHFYNMSHYIDFVPYTNEDLFNISDFRFEYDKVAFFIPDEQLHKQKILKILQKIEKEVKKI